MATDPGTLDATSLESPATPAAEVSGATGIEQPQQPASTSSNGIAGGPPLHPANGPAPPKRDQRASRAARSRQFSMLLGSVTSLKRLSPAHRLVFVGDLDWLLVPPLSLRQFRLFTREERVFAFVSGPLYRRPSREDSSMETCACSRALPRRSRRRPRRSWTARSAASLKPRRAGPARSLRRIAVIWMRWRTRCSNTRHCRQMTCATSSPGSRWTGRSMRRRARARCRRPARAALDTSTRSDSPPRP